MNSSITPDRIKGKMVLIVDDEKDVLDSLTELLAECKLDVASTFEEAKALLAAEGGVRAMDALSGKAGGAGPLFGALISAAEAQAPTEITRAKVPVNAPTIGMGGMPKGRRPMVRTPKTQQDFLLRLDAAGNITPITAFNPSDRLSVLGAKPGGPVAGAAGAAGAAGGGGGGAVIHNHFYNDSKANYQQAKKLYRSLSRGG